MCSLKKFLVILLCLSLFVSHGLLADSQNLKTLTNQELLEKLKQNLQRQDEISLERSQNLTELKSQLTASQELSLSLQKQLEDSQSMSAKLQIQLTDLEISMTNTQESLERTQISLMNLSQDYEKKLKAQKMTTVILLILSSAAVATAITSICL